jgi:hypothetical protein
MDTSASRERGLNYHPRSTDVMIATYPKCGTTWLQQILHALRTRGDMAFSEITQVVPWLEMADALGMDPRAEQVSPPRMFKTHLSWEDIPKGARYIHMTRDPRDALVSHFHFMQGWFFETGSVDIDSFAATRFLTKSLRAGGYWAYLSSWWPHRDDDNVLFLTYEDLHEDPRAGIRRIADFIGCQMDAALEAVVLERSSFEFMKAHEHQFDDHLVRNFMDSALNLEPGGDSSKVRSGQVGSHKGTLSPQTVHALDERWAQTLGTSFDLIDYAELRRSLAR